MKRINLTWKQFLLISAGFIGAFILALVLFLWTLIASAPNLDSILASPMESATYICDQDGNYLRKLTMPTSNRDIVSLDQIPQDLQEAIISIEDSRFYEHKGIDLQGILRAFVKGIAKGKFSEGASTITQQLVKNRVFPQWTQENSFLERLRRKVQEQYLALQLEKQISKEEILEDYLNTINLGAGCYGVQSASRRYFGKDVSQLTLPECAVLAAIPQNPTAFNPILSPQANQKRQRIILEYMEDQDYISDREYSTALSDDVYSRIGTTPVTYEETSAYSYYEDALINQALDILEEEVGCTPDQAYQAIYSGGLRIYSAQDPNLQHICDEAFADPSNFPESTWSEESASLQPQASLTLMDQKTGHVLALIGGRGEKTASLTLNRATESTRQPGSTFKILTAYAPALESDQQTLATLYENEPYYYENGTPVSNWDITDYSGAETIRSAITRSINVVAVKCLTQITPQAGFDFGRRFGISTLYESYETASGTASDIIQPLALGGITKGVTNLELCNAYASIANGGIYHTPRFLTKIEDRNGTVVFSFSETGTETNLMHTDAFSEYPVRNASGLPLDQTRILSESTAFLLTDAMKDVVSSPSGTAYGTIRAAGQPVAGKTGTTSNYKDIWFVGYTPYYTCCIWGGYDNNQDLPSGSIYHSYNKVLWSAIMTKIHETLPLSDFARPETITKETLCSTTHLPAKKDICPDTYTEYFAKGTKPETSCKLHYSLPETEPIYIYPELLDQISTETETESEILSEDTSEFPFESELSTNSEFTSESDSEELTTETQTNALTDSFPESETNIFDDLLIRLTEERSAQNFSFP